MWQFDLELMNPVDITRNALDGVFTLVLVRFERVWGVRLVYRHGWMSVQDAGVLFAYHKRCASL